MRISKSAQHRHVHWISFAALALKRGGVEESSADGRKVRLRTPAGEPSEWQGYQSGHDPSSLGLGTAF
jgi:hypothetical protein